MSKYVEDFSDVNVEGVEFYVKEEADGYLYKESACENKVTSDELKHAFEMGDLIIVDGDYKYRPETFGVIDEKTIAIYNKVTISIDEQTEEEVMELVPTKVSGYDEPVEEVEEVVEEPAGE